MNQASQLHQLQVIDSELDLIANRLAQIQQILASDQRVQNAQQLVKMAQKQETEARHSLLNAEDSVNSVRIKINTSESSLYGGKIKNPKELQDLQTEIAALKRRLTVLEDEQLEAMISLEQREQEHRQAVDNFNRAQAESAGQQSTLLGEKSQLSAQAEKLQTTRGVAAASILPENIQLYERLRKQKRGLAVSRVEDNSCTACGQTVRPAEIQAARAPQQMAFCSSCGRILYAG